MNFVYAWIVRDGDAEGIEKFDLELFRAPAGVAKEEKYNEPGWSKQDMASAFLVANAARNGTA